MVVVSEDDADEAFFERDQLSQKKIQDVFDDENFEVSFGQDRLFHLTAGRFRPINEVDCC